MSRQTARCASGAALIALLLLAHAMVKELDHDENQFIASGALLARHGLLPYRDYPYFHMPYLVAMYAAIFSATDHLLLGARLCSTVCSIATTLLIAQITWQLFVDHPTRFRRLAIVAIVLLFLASQAVQATAGRAWNHDVPTLLLLIAYRIARTRSGQFSSIRRISAAGILVGVAIGCRLTFAPAAGAFVLALLTSPSIDRRRRKAIGFLIGVVVALAPCGVMFALAPRGFIFGNLQYPLLNLDFRHDQRYVHGVTSAGKLQNFCYQMFAQPGNLFVVLLFVAALAVVLHSCRQEFERRFDIRLLMLLLLSVFIGALVPTPLYPQYFYTPVVFILVASAVMISRSAVTDLARRRWERAFQTAMIVSVPGIAIGYQDVLKLGSPGQSVPMLVHAPAWRSPVPPTTAACSRSRRSSRSKAALTSIRSWRPVPSPGASARSSMNHWKPA